MKIDFGKLDRLAAAGATAQVIIEFLRMADVKKSKKRARDAKRMSDKRATNGDKEATPERQEATSPPKPPDVARARLFNLVPHLVALGLPDAKARTMLGQWAKVTRDNAAAIETAVEEAEHKRPADPIGYIRACLQERSTINGRNDTMDAFDRIIAGTGGAEPSDPPMRDVTPRSG
jgi:hypothetical protein